MAVTATRETAPARTKPAVIDCDIHNALPSEKTLLQYLPERWRAYHERYGARGYGAGYPRMNLHAARTDSWPPSGLPPGADLPFLRQQLLDEWNIEYGILNCLVPAGSRNLEYSAARARAINDWQIAEWLEPEPRLRASLIVPYEDGDLAAAEIDRLGGDRRFVQITAPVQPGNSGGPVMDGSGRLIGVVMATLRTPEGQEAAPPQNLNYAVAPFVVEAFLQEHGVPYEKGKTSRETAASIAGKARAHTIQLQCWG